jgi:pimeloyl-ACP methyl ester carboxylesterase
MNKSLNFFWMLVLVSSYSLHAYEVKQTTFAFWDKPDVNLLYKLPKNIDANTKVLFIIHGQSRNADSYIEHWIDLVEEENVILVAPHFKRSDYRYFFLLETANSNGVINKNESGYLTNSIDTFFSFFKNKYKLDASKYSMFGHSAGGQFSHRYLMLSDNPKIDKAVIANPGWYTFLAGARYPYGIKDIPVSISNEGVKNFLSMRNTLMLGSKDTGSSSLNTSPGAMKQGEDRLSRGNNYFDSLIKTTKENNIPFRWNYHLVEGVDHDFRKMSDAAAKVLL